MRSFTPFTTNSRPSGDIAETGTSGCEHRRNALTPGQKKALNLGKVLGFGSFACVYEDGNDPDGIIKLTTDRDDADALSELGERNLRALPKVRGVYQLKSEAGFLRPFWALKVEKVKPLAVASNDSQSVGIFNDYLVSKYVPGKFPKKIAPSTKRFVKDCMDAERSGYLKDGFACATVVKEAIEVYNDLGKNGYTFEDSHSGNWGRAKDGRLVAIDLGFSSNVPRPKKPILALDGARKRRRRRKRRISLGAGEVQPEKKSGGILPGLIILGIALYAFQKSNPTYY